MPALYPLFALWPTQNMGRTWKSRIPKKKLANFAAHKARTRKRLQEHPAAESAGSSSGAPGPSASHPEELATPSAAPHNLQPTQLAAHHGLDATPFVVPLAEPTTPPYATAAEPPVTEPETAHAEQPETVPSVSLHTQLDAEPETAHPMQPEMQLSAEIEMQSVVQPEMQLDAEESEMLPADELGTPRVELEPPSDGFLCELETLWPGDRDTMAQQDWLQLPRNNYGHLHVSRHFQTTPILPLDSGVCSAIMDVVAGSAPALLPRGASFWDCTPPEIKNKIIGFASPALASVFHRARYISVEPRCVRPFHDPQLWVDAMMYEPFIKLRWLGGFRLDHSLFMSIKSREMFNQVSKLVHMDQLVVQRLAIRNGWPDLLDFSGLKALACAAAAEGAVSVLRILFRSHTDVGPVNSYIWYAAQEGRTRAVSLLRRRDADAEHPFSILDAAASSGNLRLVENLVEIGVRDATSNAIDWAARNGHSRVVKSVAVNCKTDCTADAFVLAYQRGHTKTLKILHACFPNVLSSIGPERFWFPRHLSSLEWLVVHRQDLDLQDLLHTALFSGGVDIFLFLVDEIHCHVRPYMLHMAFMASNVPLVEWMVSVMRFNVDTSAIVYGLIGPDADMLMWVASRDRRWLRSMVDALAAKNQAEPIVWLRKMFPWCVTQDTLEAAIRAKSHDAVRCILAVPDADQWEYARLRQVALEADGEDILSSIKSRFYKHLPPRLHPQ
ncbi:hypothetical protein HK105_201104 [Polyrhizophydium stewartii]|uniref:Ankyrin repeat protein n=1 Tax=Polyrhizophydium stewartii TaxID=2732419 RepID=A0ABR4NIW4_9FUNG